MRRLAFIGLGLVVAGLAGWLGAPFVRDIVVRGARLTHATWKDDDDKTIAEDPEELADAAAEVVGQPVTVEEYAAARMVRSEQPRGSAATKTALIHVALNDARSHGWSLIHTLTVSSNASRSGYFGRQTSRRYSTANDPYDGDLAIAREAIASHAAGDDTSRGAVKFVDRDAFETADDYERVKASWEGDGLTAFTIDGLPSDQVFFKRGAA